jgi:hypothetical protein
MTLTGQVGELIARARNDGWSTATVTAEHVRFQARWMTLTPLASRSTGDQVEKLQPIDSVDAPKASLSAVYGRGAQPLHTDGAHLEEPPDIVMLFARAPSPVPTMLTLHDWSVLDSGMSEDLRHGLFTVNTGRTQFLTPAYSGRRLRFDPGCMSPADSRARRVAAHFEVALASATPFEWDEPDKVLVIDNRRVLHARADAESDPGRTIERLAYRIERGDRR